MSSTSSSNLSVLDVLLIEDNDDDALFVRRDLKRGTEYAFVDEINVSHVKSLTDAIEACADLSFDAVFLDLGLTDSNGIETVDRFTDEEFDLPIIVLTGLNDNKTAIEAVQSGAQDYLVKGETTPKTMMRTMRHAIERNKNERQLRRQRNQMEFFNSILRHDMLNGMQIIRGNSVALAAELEGEPGEKADTILKWSDNIIDLGEKIRDILDTLTTEETTELQPVVVNNVVNDLTGEIESIRDGATVQVDCPENTVVLANDLFADVLRNLLTNAVKHTTPDDVTVEISAESHDEIVEIVVADNGPGITGTRKEEVFNRGETSSDSSGSGFGLYFVSSIIETYGGSVRLEDNDPTGARFILSLPKAK